MNMPIWLTYLLYHSICLQKSVFVCTKSHALSSYLLEEFITILKMPFNFLTWRKVTWGCAFFFSSLLFSLYLYLKTQSEYVVHDGKPELMDREAWRSMLLFQMTFAFHFYNEIFGFQNNTCYSHSLRHKTSTRNISFFKNSILLEIIF